MAEEYFADGGNLREKRQSIRLETRRRKTHIGGAQVVGKSCSKDGEGKSGYNLIALKPEADNPVD